MKGAGENYELTERSILNINSPRNNLEGPFFVVDIDVEDRNATVAVMWNHRPRLGIRWFYSTNGTPNIIGNASWHILPNKYAFLIANNIQNSELKNRTLDFLNEAN